MSKFMVYVKRYPGMEDSHTLDLQTFGKQILHLRATNAKLDGLWWSGQLLHLCKMSGQLSAEWSFDIWKNDMIENMKYLQH